MFKCQPFSFSQLLSRLSEVTLIEFVFKIATSMLIYNSIEHQNLCSQHSTLLMIRPKAFFRLSECKNTTAFDPMR